MLKKILLTAALITLATTSSQAAVSVIAGGPRVGFSVDPDQLVFGGQFVIGPIARNMTFDPSLEIGLGDDVTSIAFNFDLKYHLKLEDSDWSPYFGAGLGVHFFEFDGPGEDDSDTELGGILLVGVGVPTSAGNRFFSELRFGLADDIPSMKVMVGWNFKM